MADLSRQLTGNVFAYNEPNVIEVICDVGGHVLAFWRNMLPLS
jgi:CMP-2-keto-3-deoxyoctulosonic acid synthetase